MPALAARADFRRLLVPATDLSVPDGWTAVDAPILAGVPHRIVLTAELALLLVVPTGLATAWRDAPAAAVVTSSRPGLAARPVPAPALPVPAPPHAPARLVLLRAGVPAGAVALSAAGRAFLPEADPVPGVRVALRVREWDLRAGSLRGPGDFGSRVALAWRRVDEGSATWTPPRPVLAPPSPAPGDDLERLEGVGPVLGAALRAAGFTTFRAVAEAGPERLRAAIGRSGWTFAPSIASWPEQAQRLAEGDTAGFDALVGRLVAGRQR